MVATKDADLPNRKEIIRLLRGYQQNAILFRARIIALESRLAAIGDNAPDEKKSYRTLPLAHEVSILNNRTKELQQKQLAWTMQSKDNQASDSSNEDREILLTELDVRADEIRTLNGNLAIQRTFTENLESQLSLLQQRNADEPREEDRTLQSGDRTRLEQIMRQQLQTIDDLNDRIDNVNAACTYRQEEIVRLQDQAKQFNWEIDKLRRDLANCSNETWQERKARVELPPVKRPRRSVGARREDPASREFREKKWTHPSGKRGNRR